MACLAQQWRRFIERSYKDTDTEEEKYIRKVCISAATPVLCLCLFLVVRSGLTVQGLATVVHFFNFLVVVLHLVLSREPPRFGVGRCLLLATVFICVGDWDDAANMRARSWNLVVIILDICLVAGVEKWQTYTVLAVVILWLCVQTSEATVRYGLYEAVDIAPVGRDVEACSCASPPCALGSGALTDLITSLLVFLLDFHFTRGFSSSMRQQMSLVEEMIVVTEEVAQCMATYEVEEGRALLDGGVALPSGLKDALLRILDNLERYRPFLPDAMLARDDGVRVSVAEPPGLGLDSPNVTLCFTDIQSSTELWEKCPQGMHWGLALHNEVMRQELQANDGYEVKVIGDAFMVAFQTAENACRFALNAQEALVDARWPADLLLLPLCMHTVGANGQVLYNGPRVRIGMNSGPVRIEKNPVTGRSDYFGQTVNVAARVEAALRLGGLSGVTQAVLDELEPSAAARLRMVQVPAGEKDLKGVSGKVAVIVILAERLAERQQLLTAAASPLPMRTDTGQMSRSDSALSHVARNSGLLQLRRRAAATCTTFRTHVCDDLDAAGSSAAAMLEAVGHAADMTQGVLVGTLSTHCVAVWNGSRVCDDHYSQCLLALDHVRRMQRLRVVAGACSGELLYGTIASGRRKHAVVVGGCVELSWSLAEAAMEGGHKALAAGTFALFCGAENRSHSVAAWAERDGQGVLDVVALTDPPADDWSIREQPLVVASLDVPPSAVPGRRLTFGPGLSRTPSAA